MNAAPSKSWIVRNHIPMLAAAAVATVFSLAAVLRYGLTADYRLEAFVATDDTSFERFRAYMDEFTSNEFALVAIHGDEPFGPEAEGVLQELTAALRAVPAVARCGSIADIPVLVRSTMGDRLWSHPMLAGNLISEDRKTVAILCQMSGETVGGRTVSGDRAAAGGTEGEARRRTVARMREIVAEARASHPRFSIILTGPYVTLIDMYAYVDQDLLVFSLLAFVLIVLTLWAVFHRLQPMLYAAGVGACAVLCTLGLTVALGVVTSLITQMVVILVIVLSVANGVHLAVAAEETCADALGHGDGGASAARRRKLDHSAATGVPAQSSRERVASLARETLRRMSSPCSAAMVTTAVGFGSVCVSEIAPVRRFGGLMAFGLMLSLLISFVGVVPLHGSAGATAPRIRVRRTFAALR